MKKQGWFRRKIVQAGKRIPKSDDLGVSYSTKGAGKRFARNVVKGTGYKMPKKLQKHKIKIKKPIKKKEVKKVIIYK